MRTPPAGLALALSTILLPTLAAAATPSQRCEQTAAKALRGCIGKVAKQVRRCYTDTGQACGAGDLRIARAVGALEAKVLSRCASAAVVQGAGYGDALGPTGLAGRLREACVGEPASLAARAFGGPHAAVLASAAAPTRACLTEAFKETGRFFQSALGAQAACIKKARRGQVCDLPKVDERLIAAEATLSARILTSCPPPVLQDSIGLDATAFVARARDQVDCMTAAGHGDGGPLDLGCGPRASRPVPPRGTWVQVELPLAPGGPRCGRGEPYAFWLRLAPDGAPLERVITDLAGGGVCIFEGDCGAVDPELWSALDDPQPDGGYMSTNPAVNPFHDWTMLYMPYCTQDVHIGGGLTSVFSPSLSVERAGALNARAALGYLRDVLWTALSDTDATGWRPDRLRVLFGGESAGAFGVMYNYHFALDDLRWLHTTALPDSGLALDNGGVGVRTLGGIITGTENPLGWGTRPYQPPYCLSADCAVGPDLLAATSVRLKAVPEQQVLNLSNQNDGTQVSTTFFTSLPSWVNALRAGYCANQGKTGLRYFHPADTSNIHTMLRSNGRYTSLAAGGVTVRDYLAAAVADPDGVVDRVDEGSFVTAFPGVQPFACLGGSPSGAFLD